MRLVVLIHAVFQTAQAVRIWGKVISLDTVEELFRHAKYL